ncbi:hypothetical protein C7C46_29180 [Streptomyces tateyamensis]|uniref:Uncharacterized protein n=1 Tax=Streptomyces tateyamensis TaxID=565073 RepID=A0A2V4NYH7_9ACTN|nr:hypothetical protein [Streptomyces tateyamensis]PYC68361.1 hypothetical protein C7C46_29180 [Streptomyces tateyamensis]
MSTTPLLTSDSYERLVAGLHGRTIVAVDYFVLMVGDEGTDPDEWDYGAWHEPTMGVELTMDDGGTYSAVWGSTFDYYGVELYSAPMRDFLSRIGEPGGSARVAVAEHPLWAGVLSGPIESCRIQWYGEEHGAPTPMPKAIHVRTATAQVWIAAGRSATHEPDGPGPFYLCTDDVLVIFDADVAARAGLGV